MILRLETPPDPGPGLEGLILEETSYGTPEVAGPPSPSITLVLDGLLVEATEPEVTPIPPLAVAIHTSNGDGLLRRSGVPGVTRCFEMRLSGGWASRLWETGLATFGPSAYFTAGRINTLMAQIHVEAVRPGSGAANIGIEAGDRVLGINGRALANPAAWRRVVLDLRGRSHALVVVQRGRGRYHVTVPLS